MAPLSHIPPGHAGSEPEVRRHCLRSFSASTSTVPPLEKKCGDGLERRPPVGTRGPQGRATAYRRPSRSAGTAWNADLRSAQPAAGGRNRASPPKQKRGNGLERRPPVGTRGRQGRGTAYRRPSRSAGTAWNADLRSAQPAAGGRNRASPPKQKRGNGLERRPPVGTAARRAAKSRTAGRAGELEPLTPALSS